MIIINEFKHTIDKCLSLKMITNLHNIIIYRSFPVNLLNTKWLCVKYITHMNNNWHENMKLN